MTDLASQIQEGEGQTDQVFDLHEVTLTLDLIIAKNQ